MSKISETQQKILDVAREEFLKHGFEHSSLAEIVKKAGFTKGAFYGYYNSKAALFEAIVEPVISVFMTSFLEAQKRCFDLIDINETHRTNEVSTEQLYIFIEYVYEHLEEFRLVLCCGGGTKYENFVHDFVLLQVDETIRYYEKLRGLGKIEGYIEPDVLHMLVSAHSESIFEIVRHNYKKDDALRYIEQISLFFTAGFDRLIKYI